MLLITVCSVFEESVDRNSEDALCNIYGLKYEYCNQ